MVLDVDGLAGVVIDVGAGFESEVVPSGAFSLTSVDAPGSV